MRLEQMSVIAERISERREKIGLSRRVLGELIGSNQTQIYRYENGINDPTADVLVKLADVLHTSVDWLVGRAESTDELLSDDEKEVVQLLRSAKPERRANVLEIMRLATR